nr:hypothetical protein CFP56_60760 [Quercus suber]
MSEHSFAGSAPPTQGKQTIMLKIGRANNVTRRMTEWRRQCGYALNLVRWYPYVSPTASASPASERSSYPDLSSSTPAPQYHRQSGQMVRKVPYVKRVERLVHLELADRQVKRQCATCGREHREWFEVEASRAGVKNVDNCVRRWVRWAEERASL